MIRRVESLFPEKPRALTRKTLKPMNKKKEKWLMNYFYNLVKVNNFCFFFPPIDFNQLPVFTFCFSIIPFLFTKRKKQ